MFGFIEEVFDIIVAKLTHILYNFKSQPNSDDTGKQSFNSLTGSDIDVRLNGGPEPYIGRVEVYFGGYWGTICGRNEWDDKDANVTCRMLGYR